MQAEKRCIAWRKCESGLIYISNQLMRTTITKVRTVSMILAAETGQERKPKSDIVEDKSPPPKKAKKVH